MPVQAILTLIEDWGLAYDHLFQLQQSIVVWKDRKRGAASARTGPGWSHYMRSCRLWKNYVREDLHIVELALYGRSNPFNSPNHIGAPKP